MMKIYYLLFIFLFIKLSSSTIIIVGTGAAGIAAATRLLKNNVTDILILEAENRIGGRISSMNLGNSIIDLGAEWCDGQENNIIYDLVKDYNILGRTELTYNLFYSNGKEVDVTFGNQLFDITWNIYSPDGKTYPNLNISIGEYCINKYRTSIRLLQLNKTEEIKTANDFLDYFHKYVLSSEGAFSWFDPSAARDYRMCPGYSAQDWNGYGFKTILDILMQKFPNTSDPLPIDDKIILNKEVNKIVWDSEDNGVIVKCSDGSRYRGSQVIFTPSVGVLKKNYKTMFEPQLPSEKQRAIKTLGLGAVMKVKLLFSKQWWPEDFKAAHFLWDSEHKKGNLQKFIKNGKAWILDAFCLLRVPHSPNVLSLWFVGKSVPDIEQMNETEILDGLNFIFKAFFEKKYEVPAPTSFIKSQWYTNPHFRGTYSYQTVASRKATSNEDLGKPLSNRNGKVTLMFAGEATHPHYYATAHGAVETGYREADRVLKMLNDNKSL